MKSRRLRNLTFTLHRYIGLAVGLLLIIIGLTGSLLVFQKEIDGFLLERQFGQVIAQGQRVSVESVLNTVKAAYADRPDLKVNSIDTLLENSTYRVRLRSTNDQRTDIFVNPYTGTIIGERNWESSLIGVTFKVHYKLLADRVGEIIVGIVALLLFILCITGLILWPGWRRLISGFKIKRFAHPKRLNFDIHKVAGIVAVVFLALIAFTGFCWNFSDLTYPAIYAVTLTAKPPEPTSKFLAGKSPLGLSEILQTADAALPGAVTTYISLPIEPEDTFSIYKKFPQEVNEYGDSAVYLDQYSSEVLQVQNGRELALGERVLNSFAPLHYGTFWGLPTRILYVLVGLSPTILFITGYVMWQYRYRSKHNSPIDNGKPVEQRRA